MTRLLARAGALFIAALALLRRVRPAGDPAEATEATEVEDAATGASAEGEVPHREVPADRHAELICGVLLLLAAVFGFGFTAVYAAAGLNAQLLGIALGGMLALLAAAAIVAGKAVVPQETSVEERGTLLEAEAPPELTEMITAGGEGISRRGLLGGAAGLAGVAATTAAITPVASLGPDLSEIHHTPWRRGRRFVDEDGRPYRAADITVGSFKTALPEGADPDTFGAPLVVVRLEPRDIQLPAERRDWAPEGILAYSKICPHAACAISLFRYPQYAATATGNEQPALTCPCHYSTFLPGQGGKLIFGPAGRALPQLPVLIDAEGFLRAGGPFDSDVGPSWVDVRRPPRV